MSKKRGSSSSWWWWAHLEWRQRRWSTWTSQAEKLVFFWERRGVLLLFIHSLQMTEICLCRQRWKSFFCPSVIWVFLSSLILILIPAETNASAAPASSLLSSLASFDTGCLWLELLTNGSSLKQKSHWKTQTEEQTSQGVTQAGLELQEKKRRGRTDCEWMKIPTGVISHFDPEKWTLVYFLYTCVKTVSWEGKVHNDISLTE